MPTNSQPTRWLQMSGRDYLAPDVLAHASDRPTSSGWTIVPGTPVDVTGVPHRIRVDATLPPGSSKFELPAQWTQRAGTLNELFGTISGTLPESCTDTTDVDGLARGDFGFQIGDRGDGLGEISTGGSLAGPVGTSTIEVHLNHSDVGGDKPLYLFEPPEDVIRTIRVSTTNSCQGADENIIAHLAIDVVEIS